MENLIERLQSIRNIAETSSPVVCDMLDDLILDLARYPVYTKDEILSILDRKEGLDPKED